MLEFTFGGKNSADYGVYLTERPVIRTAERDMEFVEVSGRDGSVAIDLGRYKDVDIDLEAYISGDTHLREASAWLSGDGQMTFSDQPNIAYRAYITESVDFERVCRTSASRIISIPVRLAPFRYAYPEPEAVVFTSTGGTIENPGTAAAQPRLKIECNSDFVLTINGYTIESKSLTADGVIVDCELQDCYDLTGAQNMNTYMIIDEYPVLSPGENAISWTGGITSLEITPRWRYL